MQIGTWNKSNSRSRRAVRICDEVGGSRSDAPKVSLLRVANIRLNAGNGEIVAVGPGGRDEAGKLIPIDLKVGDTILFGKWSGTEVKIDGQDLLIMKESDIMGVIEGGAAAKKKAA